MKRLIVIGTSIAIFFSATGIMASDLVCRDDFEDGDNAGWTVVSGDWVVDSGAYYQLNPEYDNEGATSSMVTLAGGPQSDSYAVEVSTVFSLSKAPYSYAGLVFKYQNDLNYETILLLHDPDVRSDYMGIEYWAVLNGNWNLWAWTDLDKRPDEWHSLRAEVDEGMVRIFVDGALKMELPDETGLEGGAVGLYTELSQNGFDNWRVSLPIDRKLVNLGMAVQSIMLPAGIEKGLLAKLNAAHRSFLRDSRSGLRAAANQVQSFVHSVVGAKTAKGISAEEADALTAEAEEIIALLMIGC